jgi:hypothetical protein
MNHPIPFDQRKTCSTAEARAVIPCGKTKFHQLVNQGVIKTEKLGSKTLVIIASLPGFRKPEAA